MTALADLAAVRLAGWSGLPADLDVAAFAAFGADPQQRFQGQVGDPARQAAWLACDSSVYEGGLRIWVDGDAVVLVEGDDPVDAGGVPLGAPDLGTPEAEFDTVLDTLVLARGELVYASRGLAVRVNPDNGLLLGLRFFAPTSVDDYRARLRPVREQRRWREPTRSRR